MGILMSDKTRGIVKAAGCMPSTHKSFRVKTAISVFHATIISTELECTVFGKSNTTNRMVGGAGAEIWRVPRHDTVLRKRVGAKKSGARTIRKAALTPNK